MRRPSFIRPPQDLPVKRPVVELPQVGVLQRVLVDRLGELLSFIGASGSSTVLNNGRIFARLKPRSERPHVDQLIADLRPKLAAIPGIRVYPQVLPTIRQASPIRFAGPRRRPAWRT